MKIWDKLLDVDVKNKEKYLKIFSDVVKEVKDGNFELDVGEEDKGDYFIIVEENRMNSYFVHVVPKEVYDLFKEMQEEIERPFCGEENFYYSTREIGVRIPQRSNPQK